LTNGTLKALKWLGLLMMTGDLVNKYLFNHAAGAPVRTSKENNVNRYRKTPILPQWHVDALGASSATRTVGHKRRWVKRRPRSERIVGHPSKDPLPAE
jgi:hypothetical protein